MKSLFSVFTLFCLTLAFFSSAQSGTRNARLSSDAVVKDTSGRIYTSKEWQDSLSSGNYVIRPLNSTNEKAEFLILTKTDDLQRWQVENLPKPTESKSFKTGKSISSFTARDINGEKYQLKSLKGKVVVLNFWFIACSPCQKEIPELNKIVSDYKDSTDIVFLSVCLDEKSKILKFLERIPFDYAIIDDGMFIANDYGITGYPTHVVLDKDGKVAFHTTGYGNTTIPWLRKSIASVLK